MRIPGLFVVAALIGLAGLWWSQAGPGVWPSAPRNDPGAGAQAAPAERQGLEGSAPAADVGVGAGRDPGSRDAATAVGSPPGGSGSAALAAGGGSARGGAGGSLAGSAGSGRGGADGALREDEGGRLEEADALEDEPAEEEELAEADAEETARCLVAINGLLGPGELEVRIGLLLPEAAIPPGQLELARGIAERQVIEDTAIAFTLSLNQLGPDASRTQLRERMDMARTLIQTQGPAYRQRQLAQLPSCAP